MMLTSMVESDFAAAGLPPLRRGRSQQSGPDAPIEYGTPAGSVPRQGGSRRLHRGSRPNFVLMNVDDTGWGDYGFNNPAKSRDTPHLDALRAEGMRFTDLHAGASGTYAVGPAQETALRALRSAVPAMDNARLREFLDAIPDTGVRANVTGAGPHPVCTRLPHRAL